MCVRVHGVCACVFLSVCACIHSRARAGVDLGSQIERSPSPLTNSCHTLAAALTTIIKVRFTYQTADAIPLPPTRPKNDCN